MNEGDVERLSALNLITWRQMVGLILSLEVMIQSMFIWMAHHNGLANLSLEWWILQFNGLVVATNIGAVVLAILAQKTANDIGAVQSRVFTPDFYHTVAAATTFRQLMLEEAEKEGRSLDEELSLIAPKAYALARARLLLIEGSSEDPPDPAEMGVSPAPPTPHGGWDEAELFREQKDD